jgi:hypothetical protein
MDNATPAALEGYERFIGKATPKGLVLKALAKNGTTVASYFIAVRHQEFTGGLKRLGTFEAVTDPAEVDTVMFFARRAFNRHTPGDLAQWD